MADELMKQATLVVCPWCDEKKCVGRYNCPEIQVWLLKHKDGEDDG